MYTWLMSTNHLNLVSSRIRDTRNLILGLSIFSVYGHGARTLQYVVNKHIKTINKIYKVNILIQIFLY